MGSFGIYSYIMIYNEQYFDNLFIKNWLFFDKTYILL